MLEDDYVKDGEKLYDQAIKAYEINKKKKEDK